MSHQFEEEAFITVAKRTTYEDLVAEARNRQKGDERGWWDDEGFIRCIENKLKRTDGGYRGMGELDDGVARQPGGAKVEQFGEK